MSMAHLSHCTGRAIGWRPGRRFRWLHTPYSRAAATAHSWRILHLRVIRVDPHTKGFHSREIRRSLGSRGQALDKQPPHCPDVGIRTKEMGLMVSSLRTEHQLSPILRWKLTRLLYDELVSEDRTCKFEHRAS